MKKMKVTIRKDGTQSVEVIGAVGDSCVDFTKEMETRLGVVTDRELKAEYHATETVEEAERELGH